MDVGSVLWCRSLGSRPRSRTGTREPMQDVGKAAGSQPVPLEGKDRKNVHLALESTAAPRMREEGE